MIKCLYSSVSRWKVNMGENADTAPPPRCVPLFAPPPPPPRLPSIQLWVRCLNGSACVCKWVCSYVHAPAWLCVCVSMCVCVRVHVCVCACPVQSHPWLKGKGTQLCLQGSHLLLCGTMQSDCAVCVSVYICVCVCVCTISVSLLHFWT